MLLIPIFGRLRQGHLCEFEASMVYKMSTSTARATQRKPVCGGWMGEELWIIIFMGMTLAGIKLKNHWHVQTCEVTELNYIKSDYTQKGYKD